MKKVHFIGIGGYSMSGLALWLHHQGYEVTGSDMNPSSRTDRLLHEGIVVNFGHKASHVGEADLVVYNTDVPVDNVERQTAVNLGVDLRHRSEILATVLNQKKAVTVSGTHGKTTTTTMIGTILAETGWDPTVLVGGEVQSFGGNVRIGASEWAVAEADESDGTFLRYKPQIAVATNIEAEHLEHFEDSFAVLIQAFRQYLASVPHDGVAVVGIDNGVLKAIASTLACPVMTYGFDPEATVRGVIREADALGTVFDVFYQGLRIGSLRLSVPGQHNVQNALAALTVAFNLGIDHEKAFAALAAFHNANRRFQVLSSGPVRVIDDYAHHPTEIRATLEACRQVTPGRVVVLFQPQRYVRTYHLWDQFVGAFDAADLVVLTEIYSPPGEVPIAGVSGKALTEEISARKSGGVYFVPDMFDAVELVMPWLAPGDTFVTMGAGPVYKVGERVSELLA